MRLVVLLLCFYLVSCSQIPKFADDFIWGAATAAYQIEGAWNQDGRGVSIWDTYSHAGKCYNNETGDVADDHYNRVTEDIEIMKNLGIKYYRMSLSWTRILPTGQHPVNQKAVDHYNNEINALIAAGITPFVTLFHWDLPQPFQDQYGGWLDKEITDLFATYAATCFQLFGDRVKHWLTLNEPHTVAINGYYNGVHAPGRCSDRSRCEHGNGLTEPYIVAHHMLIAHAKAVKLYREVFVSQKGVIGLALDSAFGVPFSNSEEDRIASNRFIEFFVGWFADPIFGDGDYPQSMRRNVGDRLPHFTPKEKEMLRGSADFFALNHYTSLFIKDTNQSQQPGYENDQKLISTQVRNGVPIGPPADSPWLYVYPPGFRGILHWLKDRYGSGTQFYITENGVDVPKENQMPLQEALKDHFRVNYYESYLSELSKSIHIDGVKVKGYFAWSLMDNFEWNDGYHFRFGLHYVDYKTQTRYMKDSAKYYKSVITASSTRPSH